MPKTKFSFYNVTNPEVEKSACRLIEKIFYANLTLLIIVSDREILDSINKTLWTFSSKSFIPHASIYDEFPSAHQIIISDNFEESQKYIENIDVVLYYNNITNHPKKDIDRIIYLFPEGEKELLLNARAKYKELKQDGSEISYYQQQEDSSWKQF